MKKSTFLFITLRIVLKLTSSPWIATARYNSSTLALAVGKWLNRWVAVSEGLNAIFTTKQTDHSKSPNARQDSPVPRVFLQWLNMKITRNDSQRLDMLMYLGLQSSPPAFFFFFLNLSPLLFLFQPFM